MAEMNDQAKRGKGGKKKKAKHAPRVDLTPMVDLAFLLITFFMLTTSMVRPQTMEIAMPAKDDKLTEEDKTKVKASQALTLLLEDGDKIFYYFGTREGGVDPDILETTYDPEGIRRVLLSRNAAAVTKMIELKARKKNKQISEEDYSKEESVIKEDPAAPIVMIKPTDRCSYLNLVDVLDEMTICSVGIYSIIPLDNLDTVLMRTQMPQFYGTPSN